MFGYIETLGFFVGIDPDAHDGLDDGEDSEGEDEGESTDRDRANQLGDDGGLNIWKSEEWKADSQCSPDSADTVNRDGSDWVIDFQLIEEENGDHYKST